MGWFNKEPQYEAVTFYCDEHKLSKLLVDLNRAWDFGMSNFQMVIHGLPVQVTYNPDVDMFKVHLASDYVKALENYIPSASVKERYGN